jgi:hypothetical protein
MASSGVHSKAPWSERSLFGVTLASYAGVQAGLAEGFPLDAVLENERVSARAWAAADEVWTEALVDDLEREEGLEEAYNELLAEAQERYGRRVPPLDEDLAAWLTFARGWAADPEPLVFLERAGVRPSDMIRLQRLWSIRIEGDPARRREAQEILANEPGAAPVPAPEPSVMRPPAVGAGASAQPKEGDAREDEEGQGASHGADDDEEEEREDIALEGDEKELPPPPPMLMALPGYGESNEGEGDEIERERLTKA